MTLTQSNKHALNNQHYYDVKYLTNIKSPSSPPVEKPSAGRLRQQCSQASPSLESDGITDFLFHLFFSYHAVQPLAWFPATNKVPEAIPEVPLIEASPSCYSLFYTVVTTNWQLPAPFSAHPPYFKLYCLFSLVFSSDHMTLKCQQAWWIPDSLHLGHHTWHEGH